MRIAVALMIWVAIAPNARPEGLRAGAAAVEITPEIGTPMSGYYYERGAEGVHDPLHAKAIVLEVGGTRAALVALDLSTTTRNLVEDARRLIEESTDVPGTSVMISATHTHTGPVLSGRGNREGDFGGASDLARSYRDALPAKIAEAVRRAEAALEPAVARAALGSESSIAFNRRFHMRDGSVGWNPGKRNPEIVKAAGPIDPGVPILHLESPEGRPIATYVNYAVHLDNVGGTAFSADLPFSLANALEAYQGPEAVTLWTAGCCGDINHVNVQWKAPQKGHENAARMGIILAAEVLRQWPELQAVDADSLSVSHADVTLELPEIAPEDVDQARETLQRNRESNGADRPKFLELVDAYKTLDVNDRDGAAQEVEVQVITLGDEVAWVSLPGEIFVELGLDIKRDSPFGWTAIAELANGSIGYIPSRRSFTQGNYEVVSARCASGSGERLVDAAVTLLKDAYRDAQAASGPPGDQTSR